MLFSLDLIEIYKIFNREFLIKLIPCRMLILKIILKNQNKITNPEVEVELMGEVELIQEVEAMEEAEINDSIYILILKFYL